ncbi:hypothetical protein BB559_000361 [Furculomyces boomerangus]|uniref:Pyroglutamyl-peptidase I n=2 Tax=Harpellales TaxID=61421 RepID=A0A2T9Z5K9_9FUNG|nr:hypothetical protein BB559_000361 [Furculomyces boomerangus]PWA01660.1 hypothetical protein BB558_002235 [Smittium angustum]
MEKQKKTVLITGFEPFGTPKRKINRSWQITKRFTNLTLSKNDETIQIKTLELPVEYETTQKILKDVHNTSRLDGIIFSTVIHIGEGNKDKGICLEKRARRVGYIRPGNGGESDLLPNGEICGYEDDIMYTTIDVEGILKHLNAKPGEITSSDDAGLYMCELTYFISLSERKKTLAQFPNHQQNVLFVHLPPDDGPFDNDQIANIIKEIVLILS